ncbi:hypothetical protein PR048_021929 [Dryococelus australis]|uniref:Uncharacterized protein n=1 Tax=Dryococelus australis TaxID=614101 RepID=A0ABQ9GZK0_9NEOP|nr:hypothetical protein PR048_021929 [Dryococelus australis]
MVTGFQYGGWVTSTKVVVTYQDGGMGMDEIIEIGNNSGGRPMMQCMHQRKESPRTRRFAEPKEWDGPARPRSRSEGSDTGDTNRALFRRAWREHCFALSRTVALGIEETVLSFLSDVRQTADAKKREIIEIRATHNIERVSEEIWAALNSEVLRTDGGTETPEKILPTSCTIPTCEKSGSEPAGNRTPGSPRWKASSLATTAPRPLCATGVRELNSCFTSVVHLKPRASWGLTLSEERTPRRVLLAAGGTCTCRGVNEPVVGVARGEEGQDGFGLVGFGGPGGGRCLAARHPDSVRSPRPQSLSCLRDYYYRAAAAVAALLFCPYTRTSLLPPLSKTRAWNEGLRVQHVFLYLRRIKSKDYSPPTKAKRARFPAAGFSHLGIVPHDAAGRRGFLGGLPFPPPLHYSAAPYSPRSTLAGSQDLDVKTAQISSLTRSLNSRHFLDPIGLSTVLSLETCEIRRYDGNTARLARRSGEALGVRVSIARIAPSLLDLGRGGRFRLTKQTGTEPHRGTSGFEPTADIFLSACLVIYRVCLAPRVKLPTSQCNNMETTGKIRSHRSCLPVGTPTLHPLSRATCPAVKNPDHFSHT